jgi:hypothetical protein
MKLDELPRFTVEAVQSANDEGKTLIVGHLSHLRGVRSEHGFLYRANGPSLVGDLERIPGASTDEVRFITSDAEYAPELRKGAAYPWLDGAWQPYHVKMVLSPPERWQHRVFAAAPMRYFLLDGVMGWQPVDDKLPEGATDLGVRAGDANRARCELCPEELETAKSSEGFIDPDGRWICAHCFESYARHNDISFAAGDDAGDAG